MLEKIHDKLAFSGATVLIIGVALLLFTFVNAFLFLSDSLNISLSGDLSKTFGDSLAPLIATSIRVMYLGVMGWIGSLITIRGVTLLSNARKTDLPSQKPAEK